MKNINLLSEYFTDEPVTVTIGKEIIKGRDISSKSYSIDGVAVTLGKEKEKEDKRKNHIPTSYELDEPIEIQIGDEILYDTTTVIAPSELAITHREIYDKSIDALQALICFTQNITQKSEHQVLDYSRIAQRIMDEYEFAKCGNFIYYGDPITGIWLVICSDAKANRILRPLLSARYRNLQAVKEIFAEITSISTQFPRTYFVENHLICIPLSDKIYIPDSSEILDHDLIYRLTFKLPFTFDEIGSAVDEEVPEFIYEICEGENNMIMRLQEVLSIAFLNINFGKIFYIIGGEGGGYICLLQLLEASVGYDNTCNLSFADMSKNFRLAHIIGHHINISYEEGDQVVANIDTIKKLAQNVGINTDKKYAEAFDFISNAVIYCGGSKLPNVAHGNLDSMIYQLEIVRLAPVFEVSFQTRQKILSNIAIKKFRRWLFQGAIRFVRNDFKFTYASGCELSDFNSKFTDFLDAYVKFSPGSSTHSVKITELYCKVNHIPDISPRERVGLHGALQRKFAVSLNNSVRKNGKVTSGYYDIDIVAINADECDDYNDLESGDLNE